MYVSSRRRFWRYRVLALLVSMPMVNGAFAEGTVTAVFSIDSEFFKSAFPADILSQTEQSVAQSLAETAEFHFGYLDWRPAADAEEAGPRLILRMIDIGGGACDPVPSIKLQWSAVVESEERRLANVLKHDLYETCEPDIPTQEPERLIQEVVSAVTLMLDNEATRQRISDQLLKLVPIASELNNHNNIMLLLPVSPERLLADSESKMIARFSFTRPGMDPLRSRIEFQPEESEFEDSVQLWILEIRVPSKPAELPDKGAYWHELLAEILNGSASLDARVYMVDYIKNPFAGETVGESGVMSEL